MSADERHEEYIKLAVYTVECLRDLDDCRRENAKLRELCVDLYDHAAFSINYFGDMYGILPRMRDLGVEVNA